ncbi:MAG: hypothetical protein IME94_01930 [Proteobacteria bacterium]|nr:hypothetical protein [Pseudomonadota bacterium]
MKLPFRYQFILAPSVTVILLACLVAYTSYELSRIYDENEATVYWEVVNDNVQTTIATINSLNKTISKLSTEQSPQQDDNFFSYLEQSQILSDNLYDQNLLEQVPAELRQRILSIEKLLREPELIEPTVLLSSINQFLPDLEYQAKIIAAQRRTAYIDNHHKLLEIISRLTTLQISSLLVCIIVAALLALWGLFVIRQRFNRLQIRAQLVCNRKKLGSTKQQGDELDNLENCLVNMTEKLLHTVSVENVLRGVENERRRIAMDMHDGVLADLTGINRQLDNDSAVRKDINAIIDDLRRTIDDLHPQVLEILGLNAALNSWLERQSSTPGFPQYHYDFEEAIDQSTNLEQKINLFRIITEATTNVVKHAHAERLEIVLRISDQDLILTVEDNGIGMPDEKNVNRHGVANINERARLLGAIVTWRNSRFARGTCFELNLSLAKS